MEWARPDGHLVTDDAERLDLARIHRWLSRESYWAEGCSADLVARAVRGSIALGCLSPDGVQVGFARWVTDGATFGWLCDVFVDAGRRGQGLGAFIVRSAMDHPEVRGIRLLLLGTRDAHDLYRRFGFTTVPEPGRWMERRRSESARCATTPEGPESTV